MPNIFSDLAMEVKEARGDIPGVSVEEHDALSGEILISTVRIENERGEIEMGKRRGKYITITCENMALADEILRQNMSACIKQALLPMLPVQGTVLVAGLGNRRLSPDSLGPRVAGDILVTRHMPQILGAMPDERLRSVCAVSPGVLGTTGIESLEILRSIANHVRPSAIIAIDALAARRTERIMTTVQLSDAGLQPGAGVGNKRANLDDAALGIPVIAIGVPTAVYASTISRDAMQAALDAFCLAVPGEWDFLKENLRSYLDAELERSMRSLVVTPTIVDEAIANISSSLSMGINLALQSQMQADEISSYLS